MMMNTVSETAITSDTELVTRTLEGDRDAFEQIVSRYQSLICSLAYTATGSLGQSQDLAQETFITAWKHLRMLRERAKLRAWLCGIVRCLIGKTLRRQGREPTHAAEPLEAVEDSASVEPLPLESLISKEDEAVLWRAISRIPTSYREPLVLFYREHQSVEKVALALDLTEDAVKQRLSRGRKLLHQEVLTFIEGALSRSAPGQSFTLGVLAALPVISSSSATAGFTATIVKSGAGTKLAAWLAGFNALAGPMTGFAASYLGYKLSMERATSDQERKLIKRFYGAIAACIIFPFAIVLLAMPLRSLLQSHPGAFAGLLVGISMLWIPGIVCLLLWTGHTLKALSGSDPAPKADPLWEYRSRRCLFGLPLIHIRFGATWRSLREITVAWIAVGDGAAAGVIFAFGGIAVAPICIGGFALGGLVFGGFGIGGLCYAGFALGIWALGGIASGWLSLGGCALAWKAAVGGVAIARDYAQGGVALATHANDLASHTFCDRNVFFQNAYLLVTKWLWPTLLASLIPTILIGRASRRRRQTQQ
jgi:RNA polymerase sigma factor (sigma-70 family)